MLTGEFIDADEAYRIGLVNKLVPVGEEEKEAERLARVVMSDGDSPTQSTEADFETALNLEKQTIATLVTPRITVRQYVFRETKAKV